MQNCLLQANGLLQAYFFCKHMVCCKQTQTLVVFCILSCPGGVFTSSSAERLLHCLVLACPLLEELHVLPEPTCGLGDDQVDHLLALTALKVRWHLHVLSEPACARGFLEWLELLEALESSSVH